MEWLKIFIGFLSGFRKFTVMVMAIAIAIFFRVNNYINGQEFVELLKDCIIAFMGANGVEHITSAASKWMDNKITEEVHGDTDG